MSVTAAKGFVASGVHCGLKPSGDLDLALVATDDGRPVEAAAVFTDNKMTAAPVLTSDEHLRRTAGSAVAVVLNAGNANAATGAPGRRHAQEMCAAVADELGCAPHEVLVCSTGLIGIPLPIDAILGGVPDLVAGRGPSGADAAEAIRTTDTHRKETVVAVGSSGAVVGGMAKGAAMLAPNMATMLAVITTDAEVASSDLRQMLRSAVSTSFNVLMTDACRSTNDTVIVLASGEAGARQIARSALCKCSWFGQDPYWGRLASELGSAGIAFDQEKVSVAYGDVTVAAGGVTIPHDEAAVAAHMAGRHLDIDCDLGLGAGEFMVLTNDLTHEYVDENTGGS